MRSCTRNSARDALAFRVFKELAGKEPFNLRIALEKITRELIARKKEIERVFAELEKEIIQRESGL